MEQPKRASFGKGVLREASREDGKGTGIYTVMLHHSYRYTVLKKITREKLFFCEETPGFQIYTVSAIVFPFLSTLPSMIMQCMDILLISNKLLVFLSAKVNSTEIFSGRDSDSSIVT